MPSRATKPDQYTAGVPKVMARMPTMNEIRGHRAVAMANRLPPPVSLD